MAIKRVDNLNEVSAFLKTEVTRVVANVARDLDLRPDHILDAARVLNQIDKLQGDIVRFTENLEVRK